ncbi:hypothetical protein NPJ88_000460 [Halomonas elongata]|uniref:hypothetical protein n=1 Tax=Halomonas elongata TaxID=2746 RepID=UPI00255ABAAE|nr:hypothetical protein [Halomonas elongata]MDL4860795.1 hypothetical protein [Halomonas elongata]
MSIEELLASKIEDETEREEVLNALQEDRAGLEANKQQLLDEKKRSDSRVKELEQAQASMKERLDQFGDLDPEKVKEMFSRFDQDQDAKDLANGDVQSVVERKMERERASFKTEIQSRDERIQELEQALGEKEENLTRELLDNRGIRAASELGIEGDGNLEIVSMVLRRDATLEDGEPVFRDADGNLITGKNGPMTIQEYLDGPFRDKYASLFPQPKGTQAPGSRDGRPSKANPWKPETKNRTEQARLMREEPEEAKRMMAEAGLE